jgi:hypothetical protein
VQGWVGHALDLELVEVAPRQVRFELKRSEPENGRSLEVTSFEVRPCFCLIDGVTLSKKSRPSSISVRRASITRTGPRISDGAVM